MTLLILGLIVFIGIHLVPSFTGMREGLVNKLGLLPYKGLFAVVSFLGLFLIVQGKGSADFVAIWNPPAFMSAITKLLMLPAMVFLVAAYIPCNIKVKLKHPMMIGVKTWALAHLLANGDLASIVLFGSFLAFAVFSVISGNKRGNIPEKTKKPVYIDIAALLGGGVLYAAIGMHHMQLFGVPIM